MSLAILHPGGDRRGMFNLEEEGRELWLFQQVHN